MREAFSGVKQLVWNREEARLRALFRVPVVLMLVVLAAVFINTLLDVLEGLVAIPGPLFTILWMWLLAVAVVAIVWFFERRRRRDLGIELDGQWWRDAVAGLAAGLAMVAAVVVVLRLAGFATVGGAYRVSDPALSFGGSTRGLLYGLGFFVAVAVLEELLVRGYLLTNVAEGVRGYAGDRRAVWIAIAGTALLFGVLHAANPGGTLFSFLNIALAGLLLGVAYAATGRLGFPIGLHTTWNFGLGPLFGLPVSGITTDTALVPVQVDGPRIVTGGSFGPEGGAVMLVALAVGTATLGWWVRSQGDDLSPDEHIAIPDLWIDDRDDS